jgi:hypothetical protein
MENIVTSPDLEPGIKVGKLLEVLDADLGVVVFISSREDQVLDKVGLMESGSLSGGSGKL